MFKRKIHPEQISDSPSFSSNFQYSEIAAGLFMRNRKYRPRSFYKQEGCVVNIFIFTKNSLFYIAFDGYIVSLSFYLKGDTLGRTQLSVEFPGVIHRLNCSSV